MNSLLKTLIANETLEFFEIFSLNVFLKLKKHSSNCICTTGFNIVLCFIFITFASICCHEDFYLTLKSSLGGKTVLNCRWCKGNQENNAEATFPKLFSKEPMFGSSHRLSHTREFDACLPVASKNQSD